MTYRRLMVAGASVICFAFTTFAQVGNSEALLRLDLRRAEVKVEVTQAAFDQKTAMFEEGLVSKAELMDARADVEMAKIDEARARLVLANELPSFRVVSAVKSLGELGQTHVRLKVQELRSAPDYEDLRSYLISLLGQGTIIGVPYQQQVTMRGPAKTTTLEFQLLRDAEDLTVLVVSGARREEIPIVLQRTGVGKLVMSSANFSQAGVFGDKVDYSIQLQRFSPDIETVALELSGLPSGFTSEWIDRDTGAKLNSIRFGENQNALRLTLRVFLPARVDEATSSQLLGITVTALSPGTTLTLATVALQLQTTGVPQLALIADNLLFEISRGESKRIAITVENTGPVEARDVMLRAELPVGIECQMPVPAFASLAPNQRRTVNILLRGAEEAVPGEYTVKLNALTQSRMTPIESPDVSLRVMVRSSSLGVAAGTFLVIILAALGGVLTWWLRRVRRR